jgi:hypothetical protein
MISKTQMTQILILLDDLGMRESCYEYGLPVWDEKWMALARESMYELLHNLKGENEE